MTEFIKAKIEEVVTKIKKTNPKEKDSVKTYVQRIIFDCISCTDDAFLYAMRQYEELDLYDKPVNYFIAIVKNSAEETKRKRELEYKRLGSVPGVRNGD